MERKTYEAAENAYFVSGLLFTGGICPFCNEDLGRNGKIIPLAAVRHFRREKHEHKSPLFLDFVAQMSKMELLDKDCIHITKCDYCLRGHYSEEVKLIELTPDGGRTYLAPIKACDQCRAFLRGVYRLAH